MKSVPFQISTKAVEKFMSQRNINLWLHGNSALFASVRLKIRLARLLLVEVSCIEFQRNLRNDLWDTRESPFTVSCKPEVTFRQWFISLQDSRFISAVVRNNPVHTHN
jgi:hypothetical protein